LKANSLRRKLLLKNQALFNRATKFSDSRTQQASIMKSLHARSNEWYPLAKIWKQTHFAENFCWKIKRCSIEPLNFQIAGPSRLQWWNRSMQEAMNGILDISSHRFIGNVITKVNPEQMVLRQ